MGEGGWRCAAFGRSAPCVVVLEFEATKWPGTYLKLNTGKVARRGKEEAPGSVAESSESTVRRSPGKQKT